LVVLPFLKSQGIKHIDKVIVSNGDSDHRGGLHAVMENRSIGELLSGEPQRIPGVASAQCLAGLNWEWDGVRFEILHPDGTRDWKGNNASCVLAVRSGTGQLLLTGDIEAAAEASLIAHYSKRLTSQVVTVPHHGSASSSGKDFIKMTQAQYGLISAGYKNRYNFPREDVRLRWQNAKTTLLNTAESGAISLILTPDGTIHGPWAYRAANRRYWMSAPM
jgi:competence protein ComEC